MTAFLFGFLTGALVMFLVFYVAHARSHNDD
jgi:hypothetical protein